MDNSRERIVDELVEGSKLKAFLRSHRVHVVQGLELENELRHLLKKALDKGLKE
jgi:hypothetical protein